MRAWSKGWRNVPRLVAALASVAWVGATADVAKLTDANCLFAITVGHERGAVVACPDADPLGVGNDPSVRSAMKSLGIVAEKVRFKGCGGQPFAVYLDAPTSKTTYVITYPSERSTTYLAPVLHELAHVMQMETNGGLDRVREKYKISKRIELEADYMTGLLFATEFPSADLKAFEQNLGLIGLYYESNGAAHGTPFERNNAFRRGAFTKLGEIDPDLRKASVDFQRNIYGEVIASSRTQ